MAVVRPRTRRSRILGVNCPPGLLDQYHNCAKHTLLLYSRLEVQEDAMMVPVSKSKADWSLRPKLTS